MLNHRTSSPQYLHQGYRFYVEFGRHDKHQIDDDSCYQPLEPATSTAQFFPVGCESANSTEESETCKKEKMLTRKHFENEERKSVHTENLSPPYRFVIVEKHSVIYGSRERSISINHDEDNDEKIFTPVLGD